MASRKFTLSRVQPPCLKLPFRLPRGPPEPLAPPCMRQRVADLLPLPVYRGDRLESALHSAELWPN